MRVHSFIIRATVEDDYEGLTPEEMRYELQNALADVLRVDIVGGRSVSAELTTITATKKDGGYLPTRHPKKGQYFP